MGASSQAQTVSCETSGASYLLTCLTMILGYSLFVCGIILPSWRLEIGYTYGLWVRCDGDVCRYVFVGFTSFMAVVQVGVIISLLLLTMSMLCLLLELCLRHAHVTTKCLVRTSTVVSSTAVMGEILSALTLAYYGYKTVMAIDRLPELTTGFALTGLGTIILLLGSISRAMGAPATWGDGVCCLAAKRRYNDPLNYITGTESQSLDSYYYNPTVGDDTGAGDKKVLLISCFHKKANTYTTADSNNSSSVSKGYRHYEEISFEEMPHPPVELLVSPPLIKQPWNFQQDPVHDLDYKPYLYTTPQ